MKLTLKKAMSISVIAMSLLTLAACSSHRHSGAAGTGYEGSDVDAGVLNGQGLNADGSLAGANGSLLGADGQPLTTAELIAIKTYHFAYDSADLLPGDKQAVIAQAHYLASNPNKHILLAGNTDARGSREYNIALGWRRAQSVEDVMLLNGVKKDQIELVSYGEEKPVAFGDSEEAYQQNRRVDLTYEN